MANTPKLLSQNADGIIMQKYIVLAILTLGFLIGFQNCQSFDKKNLENLSSNCKDKLRAKAIQLGGWSESECQNNNHYSCDLKIYGTEIENSVEENVVCTDVAGENVCLTIQVNTYNTSALLSDSTISEKSFIEGGALNRSEYRCIQNGIIDYGHPVITSIASGLHEALALAKASCMQGVRL